MSNYKSIQQIALSFPEATEQPHFEKTSFRVGKKIFATLDIEKNLLCVKFTEIEQQVFSAFDKSIIYPVPNKWGKQGATFIDLNKVKKEVLLDALKTSYVNVAPKKLSAKII